MEDDRFDRKSLIIGAVLMLVVTTIVSITVSLFWGAITESRLHNEEPDYSITLVQGEPVSAVNMLTYQALDSECAGVPAVLDVRADDDPSLGLLPRLGLDDWVAAQNFFKFKHLDTYGCSAAQPGEKYWDLYAIEVKCGPAVLQPQVQHMDGVPITEFGVLMFLNWPGADVFPYSIDPPYAQSGVAGFTDNGSIGWGFGGESYIGPDGGPFLVWASSDPVGWSDRVVGSDALDDVGWFDNHCVPNPIFRVVRKEGEQPTPTEGYELVDYDEEGNEIGHIPFLTGSVPPNDRKLGLRLDGVDIGYVPWVTD